MAGGSSINGLTITIDGDPTGLSKALQAVKLELARRETFRQRDGILTSVSSTDDRFYPAFSAPPAGESS